MVHFPGEDDVRKSPVDRRSHARFTASFEVEGATQPGGSVARMVASDLSLGGIYCSSAADFPEMTRLAVRLLLPSDGASRSAAEPLDLEAVVVRRKKLPSAAGTPRVELALFFTSMSDLQRERIAKFLAHA
jgi:PilZ domain-containing protein